MGGVCVYMGKMKAPQFYGNMLTRITRINELDKSVL